MTEVFLFLILNFLLDTILKADIYLFFVFKIQFKIHLFWKFSGSPVFRTQNCHAGIWVWSLFR